MKTRPERLLAFAGASLGTLIRLVGVTRRRALTLQRFIIATIDWWRHARACSVGDTHEIVDSAASAATYGGDPFTDGN
ncbi:MAG: hypothetical protein DME50_10380 [Verrucomicrobia bacterium]|nr:MAG: hypothetical protein DME85_05115 [Verrucomicrobiota bacterium]PYK65028.1 MAG: hypothetical protein DME50_10380 [Verrucomicrobiota bacterium]